MKWILLEVIKYMAQFSEDFMFQYQITSCDRADMFALGTHIIINLLWLLIMPIVKQIFAQNPHSGCRLNSRF